MSRRILNALSYSMKVFFSILFLLILQGSFHFTTAQSFTLYLIGDAGENITPGPALQLLEFKLKNESRNSAVIFLGDNSYEQGLFPEESRHREQSELELHSQLGRLKEFRGQAYMI